MTLQTRHTEVLVVGAGPAGMAAATAAARHGSKVLVLDDNPDAGGQIWRTGISPAGTHGKAKRHTMDAMQTKARAAFHASGAELLAGRRVVDAPANRVLRTVVDLDSEVVQESVTWDRLILATGARERFLPFPGWTLPGVFGAGGLQALVKGGYSVEGKRVVVAGTGPLLLAVAAHLRQYGATVLCIAEQASYGQLAPFAASLWSHPGKLLQGVGYRRKLGKAPYRIGWWPSAIEKTEPGLLVRLTNGVRVVEELCDMAAVGFHLVPNTELGELLGCELNDDFIAVNQLQQTSVDTIYCVGEPTGIAGLDAAMVQGEIAGLVASGHAQQARAHFGKRAKEEAFGRRLNRAFRLRPEVLSLAQPETILCRCEDVPFARLEGRASWTEAKLQTRCGMGPCQGRICGPAVQSLFGWRSTSVRPPLFPVPISIFGTNDNDSFQETNIYSGDTMNWFGVMPAMTTPFDSKLAVDHTFLARHATWLLDNGCTGLVMLGSLGEGATLEHAEKVAILKTVIEVSAGKTPVVASISSLSTANAIQLAKDAEEAGCDALMVLPPYVYTSDWDEMKEHVSAVISATKLPCMLYNNPVAYKTDFLPEQIAELAAKHENLQAVKESSADVRRVAAIRSILGDRLTIFVGVDDVLVEAVYLGATGWVAGLVNAFPAESVELFNLALTGKQEEAFALYRWFLPLLRMDTVPKFVQLIKWVQEETGTGSATVRAPRQEIHGAELAEAQRVLKTALADHPAVRSTPFPKL